MSIFELVIDKITEAPQSHATKIVAIDGRGGSGKSTFARELIKRKPEFKLIELDLFPCTLKEHEFHLTGTQTRISTQRLINQVFLPLRNGETAKFSPTSWWRDDTQAFSEICVAPGGVVLAEGCYSHLPELRQSYALSIWIECDAVRAMNRALMRDGEGARDAWVHAYLPNENSYVNSYNPRNLADIVIFNDVEKGFYIPSIGR